MNKIILILLVTISSLYSYGISDRQYVKSKTYVECISGYKFVVVHTYIIEGGIAIAQVYQEGKDKVGEPQPIKCEEK